jgi:hypothetical protein
MRIVASNGYYFNTNNHKSHEDISNRKLLMEYKNLLYKKFNEFNEFEMENSESPYQSIDPTRLTGKNVLKYR